MKSHTNIDEEISKLDEEILYWKKYQSNLKTFLFYQTKRQPNFSNNFYKILEELDRISIIINKEKSKRKKLIETQQNNYK